MRNRITLIRKKLLRSQSIQSQDKNVKVAFNSLANIVSEFQFSEDKSPLQILITKLFTQQRKLQKKIVEPQKMDRSNLNSLEIILNVRF